jgi:hypothetical protein
MVPVDQTLAIFDLTGMCPRPVPPGLRSEPVPRITHGIERANNIVQPRLYQALSDGIRVRHVSPGPGEYTLRAVSTILGGIDFCLRVPPNGT